MKHHNDSLHGTGIGHNQPDDNVEHNDLHTPDRGGDHDAMKPWGWSDRWNRAATEHGADGTNLTAARVVRQDRHVYTVVIAPDGRRLTGQVSGAFSYRAVEPADYPAAGDWVLVEPEGVRIQFVLPRSATVSRQTAGEEATQQVIAANVDVLFLVFGLDGGRNFTVGMLERSLVAAWESGARPVVVLNKADLATDEHRDEVVRRAESAAVGVPIHVVSAVHDAGIEALMAEARPGTTVGLLGKSGVGKSALLNAMARAAGVPAAGEDSGTHTDQARDAAPHPVAREGHVRRGDLQGRHTTTHRQLFLLPNGPVVADVPGLRELQLWGEEDTVDAAFPDIEALAAECRFSDCRHQGEPGCRIQAALSTGELSADRYARYQDYQRELAYLERRRDQRAAAEEQRKWKKIAQDIRHSKKGR